MQQIPAEWDIVFKISGIVSSVLVGIFGYFITRSYNRTDTDIKQLFADIKSIYNRINEDKTELHDKIDEDIKDVETRINLIEANFYQMRGEHNSNHRGRKK